MSNPNLQQNMKEDWVESGIVMPVHMNDIGKNVNNLNEIMPVYSANGSFYTLDSVQNSVYNLKPVVYTDDSINVCPTSYFEGMEVCFKLEEDNIYNCKVNVNNLGAKNIKKADNTPLDNAYLTAGNYMTLRFDSTQDCFYLVSTPASGAGLEIGDIGIALYVDESKGLRRYLNGSTVAINTNTQAFLDKLKAIRTLNPEYFTDEVTWQTEALLNIDGCVYKFVIDEVAGTIRLPKYPEFVEITNDNIPVIGNGYGLGLTDGTQTFMPESSKNGDIYGLRQGRATVPSLVGTANTYIAPSVNSKTIGVTTDPTKSGLETSSDSVTKLKLKYFIQIATGQETRADITNEIELNNPFSLFDSKYSDHELNNLSWLRSQGQYNSSSVYPDAYQKLLKIYNGTETVEGITVKAFGDSTITDYDFVIDAPNMQFRLPIKTNLASGKSVVGNGMTLGLTNGSIQFGLSEGTTYNVLYASKNIAPVGSSSGGIVNTPDDKLFGVTTDGTKSGIETDSTGLYLYYYVGETVQNANLIDAGRIAEQVVEKVDTSASNLNPDGKSLVSGLGMPSERYIDLELGASGTTYTAPANGYFVLHKKMGATNKYLYIFNTVNELASEYYSPLNSTGKVNLPVLKNDVVQINYDATGATAYFRFIYAEGEQ